MKRKKPYLLAGLVLLLFLLCTACGNTEGQIAPQDDPNEGLGGGLSEDTVNDFSGFEGIWLGEANNDYDSMEFDAEGNWTLYLSGEVMEYLWHEDDEPDPSGDDVSDWNGRLDGNPDSYWSWDSDLCQRNVSEFKGIWYYDGDLSAETYIVIDGNGNWSYYQRAPGAEPAEMDCGVFTYSMDEVSTYYADSTTYAGVSYRVFEMDEDSLVWGDEGVYYLME